MSTPVRLPNLGAEAAEARVVAWLRAVGDVVVAGEPIAEIETEKATVELEAPMWGVPTGAWRRTATREGRQSDAL